MTNDEGATMIDLDELERLEKEANKRPWRLWGNSGNNSPLIITGKGSAWDPWPNDAEEVLGYEEPTYEQEGSFKISDSNREIIIALRNAAPELIKLARWAVKAKANLQIRSEGRNWIGPLLNEYPRAEGDK